jgi:hypothetical protein
VASLRQPGGRGEEKEVKRDSEMGAPGLDPRVTRGSKQEWHQLWALVGDKLETEGGQVGEGSAVMVGCRWLSEHLRLTPVIPALGRLRFGGSRFETNLGKKFTRPQLNRKSWAGGTCHRSRRSQSRPTWQRDPISK